MYHYNPPPPPHPGWSAYDYASPPTSPAYAYYATPYASPYVSSPRGTSGTSSKRHTRKASYAGPSAKDWGHPASYSHSYYDAPPEFGTPPPRKHDPVSASSGYPPSSFPNRRSSAAADPRPPHKQRHAFMDVVDDVFDDVPQYVFHDRRSRSPPPSYSTPRRDSDRRSRRPSSSHRKPKPPTDQYFYYNQVPAYDDADLSSKRSRARRQSTSTRTPSKPKSTPSTKTTPVATEEDAERAGIPAGYSTKNWDPTEAPIVLLGSVFDANSLGKWIYDWTVFHNGASTPMADVAGDMWLLLIKLAGKVKRADECLDRIQRRESRETVADFLESGERLWMRFKKLLKACEHFMWKVAKREGKAVSMGRNAGCEFVESLFGRDRELENTEKLMNSIRLWNMRFDANCDEILRRPSA